MSEALRIPAAALAADVGETTHREPAGHAQLAVARDPAYLQVHNLIKQYGDFVALNGVSLSIAEGEFICFLGPSGCGKTTLLRAIAGLDFQTAGSLIQDGVDISWLPPNKRDFGIVFQSYALFPNLTVAQNIAFGLHNARLPKAQIAERVQALLDNIGLPQAAAKYPGQLSGGQQQRVALARALATSPSLLLLDEPLSALDAQVRVHLRREIKRLQHQLGITTIMVTHDQEEAMSMADRIVVMNHGHIEQVGTPQQIYQHPASVFVAEFVGTINLLPCRVCGPDSVEVGGTLIRCRSTAHLSDSQGLLGVRPEDIVLHGNDESVDNALDAQVDSLEFLGSFVRLKLLQGETPLTVDLSMHLFRRFDLTPGSQLKLSFDPALLHLFDHPQD